MVVSVKDIAGAADSAEQGNLILASIRHNLMQEDVVYVRFDDVETVTTSFVNCAILPLLVDLSFDEFKRRVQFKNCTWQIKDVIKRRVLHETAQMRAA